MTYSFISYGGSEGEGIAKSLLDVWSELAMRRGLLENNGTNPFFAPRSIYVGDKWEEKITEAVRQCEWLLAIVTKEFNHSDWAKYETAIAIGMGKRVFPILGEDMIPENLPCFLKSRQAIFFADTGKIFQMLDGIVKEQAAMVLDVDDSKQNDKADDGLSAVDSQPVKRYIRRRRIIRPGNVVRPLRRLIKPAASSPVAPRKPEESSVTVVSISFRDDIPKRRMPPFSV